MALALGLASCMHAISRVKALQGLSTGTCLLQDPAGILPNAGGSPPAAAVPLSPPSAELLKS